MSQLNDFSIPRATELITDAGNLCGLRWGTPGENPILALHGWLDNAASFGFLSPLLDNADIVAFDLPGHGCSEHRPLGSTYHFIDYIPVVLEIIKELRWKRCLLIGHSLGAGIASFAAAAAPETISGLFLIDGLGPHTEDGCNAGSRLQKSLRKPKFSDKTLRKIHPSLETMIDARCRAGKINKESAKLLVERNAAKVEDGFCWRTDPRLLFPSPQYMTEEQVSAVLGLIKAPTILALASHGLLKNQPNIRNRIGWFVDLDVQEFVGGHHFHLDNPGPLAKSINRFINKISY